MGQATQEQIFFILGVLLVIIVLLIALDVFRFFGYGPCIKESLKDIDAFVDGANEKSLTDKNAQISIDTACMEGILITTTKPDFGEYRNVKCPNIRDGKGTFVISFHKGAGFFEYIKKIDTQKVKGSVIEMFQLANQGDHTCRYIPIRLNIQPLGIDFRDTEIIRVYKLQEAVYLVPLDAKDSVRSMFCINYQRKAIGEETFLQLNSIRSGGC